MDTQQKDEALWKLAKRRAGFKCSLASYIVVNSFLIIAWLFSAGYNSYFWPAWSLFGWGISLLFQYFYAYHGGGYSLTEAEYEKLKKQNQF